MLISLCPIFHLTTFTHLAGSLMTLVETSRPPPLKLFTIFCFSCRPSCTSPMYWWWQPPWWWWRPPWWRWGKKCDLPTDQPTYLHLTWVGARDACASKNGTAPHAMLLQLHCTLYCTVWYTSEAQINTYVLLPLFVHVGAQIKATIHVGAYQRPQTCYRYFH